MDAYISAEDLFNKSKKKRGRPAGKGDDAKVEILRLLNGGVPMPSVELESAVCEMTDCHHKTVNSAKKELGVESCQSGRQWFSVLQDQSTEIRQDTINIRRGNDHIPLISKLSRSDYDNSPFAGIIVVWWMGRGVFSVDNKSIPYWLALNIGQIQIFGTFVKHTASVVAYFVANPRCIDINKRVNKHYAVVFGNTDD